MDVNRPKGVQLVGDQPRQYPQRRNLPELLADDEEQGEQHAAWSEQAAVEIDGSLTVSISPEAQTLLDALSAQIEPLRLELKNTKASEARYKEMALQHSILSIPNRREFFRELAHVLNHFDSLLPPPAFGIIHLDKAEYIRRTYGRDALDRALVHAAALIVELLHPTDVVGSLCGSDFGVILLNADEHAISELSNRLTARFTETPFSCAGDVGFSLQPLIAVVVIESAWTVDQVMEHADGLLLNRFSGSGDDVREQ